MWDLKKAAGSKVMSDGLLPNDQEANNKERGVRISTIDNYQGETLPFLVGSEWFFKDWVLPLGHACPVYWAMVLASGIYAKYHQVPTVASLKAE
jgi:hypothetical protein